MYIINNSPDTKQYTYLLCSAAFRQLTNEDGRPVCEEGTYRFRYDQVEQFILENVNEFGVSEIMQMSRTDEDIRRRDEELASLSVTLEDLLRREARLLSLLENEDVEDLPGLLALAKQRSKERADTEELVRTLKLEREIALAKKQTLDPASAVQAMREAWMRAGEADDRYGLRVRCNVAMRDFINSVQFDSRDGSYTVILFDGYRAYKFFNVPRVRQATQVPLVVDLQPFVSTGLWTSHAAHQKAPLQADRALVNVLRDVTLTARIA
ncbi:hypothetical protein MetexDRAFT_6183 [Methylorubrum extorquens DSM 13060]|uniref:Uncharacterized protein n=1 Tax=Methylorubrum extorquens DSM 13060 TaxID=882800 RepID=H1KU70_METEX|nr:hypothetical protein MetexDRAFT_6183 [Methylorubrum extorquens DSM 13060]